MTDAGRRRALEESGLAHPAPEKVSAPMFATPGSFFQATDKVQVKYEMLRAHALDGMSAITAASTDGYSRAVFYLAVTAFEQAGMVGLAGRASGPSRPA